MRLAETIAAAGMTPPKAFTPGRWLRFPGIGKGRANRSGWCRVISPTLAIFGDWSSAFTQVWRDESHRDDARSLQALRDAQERERRFAREQRAKQASVARDAQAMVSRAVPGLHPYLARKGFPSLNGLLLDGKLLVPVMDFERYPEIITAQLISEDGEKKFLTGGRAKGGVYQLGVSCLKARHVALCEGYATGLSVQSALRMITGAHCVLVCFSARNLELVASLIGSCVDAAICADNDLSGTGQDSAKRTGRRWVMPETAGTDYNDLHISHGIRAVLESIRTVF
jgi:putative DNA primase/helicase